MSFFFFNDTATTEIYTLSLHDALPIFHVRTHEAAVCVVRSADDRLTAHVERRIDDDGTSRLTVKCLDDVVVEPVEDRKSTRLNSSHANISYAVFCLKKKNKNEVTFFRQ